jgi:hypothetical protein
MVYGMIVKTLTDEFWGAKKASTGIVRIEVRSEMVDYVLYGSCIATLDREAEALTLRDCGYQTMTTKLVLNEILSKIHYHIYASRDRWIVYDAKAAFLWQDSNMFIHGELVGGVPVPEPNIKMRALAKKQWDDINTTLVYNRVIPFATLSGEMACVLKGAKRFNQDILIIKEENGDIGWAYSTLARTTLLHAVRTGDFKAPDAWRGFGTRLMSMLDGVDISMLPKPIMDSITARVALS